MTARHSASAPPLAAAAPPAPPDQRPGGLRHALRTVWVAFWLGWQVEANWTDPLLFATYVLVRPLGGVLILVFMFRVVAGGGPGAALDFFVVGSAFWPLVLNGMQGMTWGFLDDRERFRTLRYVYTAPVVFPAYLLGRALVQSTTALAAVAVTLVFGRLVLAVPLSLTSTNWPYLLLAMALGLAATFALGLLGLTVVLGVSRESWRLPEAMGAALFLLCGAIFPVTVLPAWVVPISMAIPLTWWLEALRRALLGPAAMGSFPHLTDGQVLVAMAATTVAATVLGLGLYRWAENRARSLGRLDQDSAF